MKNSWMLLFVATLMLFSAACQKEEIDTPIWFPRDTIDGFAVGKKNSKDYKASVILYTPNAPETFSLDINTYTTQGFHRENLLLRGIPFKLGIYDEFYLRGTNKLPISHFYTFQADGDVVGDSFTLDLTSKDNQVVINYADTIKLEVRGRFTMTFIYQPIQGLIKSSGNPDKITFKNVYFEARLPQ